VITQKGVGTMVSQSNEPGEIVRTFARMQAMKIAKNVDEEMQKGEFLTIVTPPHEPEFAALS
jgi:hypothetical protein